MKGGQKHNEARAWFYTFKTEQGFQVESRTGKVLYWAATWEQATQWAMENLNQIDDHANPTS